YWDNYPTAGNIFRSSVPPTQVLTIPTDNLTGIRLVGDTIYYIAIGVGLCRVGIAGGAPTTIVAGIGSWEMAMDGDDVYLATSNEDRILHVSLAGGTSTELGPAVNPWGIAVDATDVYFANENGDTIARVPRVGGAVEVLATAPRPLGIAVDDAAMYWTT